MNSLNRKYVLRISVFFLLVIALLAGSVTITRAAAQAAIPGDALYPLKTTIEQARLTLAQDAGVRAEMRMAFAEQRLDEIKILIAEGRFKEVAPAVLAFETNINQAILELETVAQVDPTRAARLALEITAALTRYAQALSVMAASAPESVQIDVSRALDTTQIVGGMQMPVPASNENGNTNADDGNANEDGLQENANGDDSNSNGDEDANGNGDDANGNSSDDEANSNGDDDNSNGDDNSNCNENDDDCSSGSNSNGDDSNSNGDDSNSNGDDSNSNGDDSGSGSNGNGGDDNSGGGSGGNGNDDD